MTSKQRLLDAINFRQPDRPPVYCSIVPQLAGAIADRLDMTAEAPIDSPMSSNRISWMDLMLRLGSDCVCVASCAPDNAPTRTLENGLMVNEWGIGMRNHGLYDDFELHPLAHAESVADIEAYAFPDPDAPGRFRRAQESIDKYGRDYGIIGDLECSIFETSWYLVGLEKLFMGMAMEEPWVDALFDKVADFHTRAGCRLAAMGADVIWCGDDIGSQNGPMISVDMFDRYFFPRISRMFAAFKKVNPQVKIAWHSCGSILPFIPRFIAAGLDILNPIQPLAAGMDPAWLKAAYGDRLAFFGGICVQELLPHGTPEQIRKEVRRRVSILGEGGGYILAPAHNIQADTSVDNILAFFEAATGSRP